MTSVMSEPTATSTPLAAPSQRTAQPQLTAQSQPSAPAPFAALPARSRAALQSIARPRRLDAGSTALAEGARAEAFFLLTAGQVKMSRLTPSGRNLILSLFGPGDLFGVTAALSGEPCSAAWEAVIDSDCLEVRRSDLFALLARQPELVPELLPFLSRQLMECRNCLVETSCSRVETRFASLFLGLAAKLGRPGESGWFIPLPLSRQELADLTGTTLETAIRVMSRWGKERLVSTSREGFLLHDRSGLEALSWS
jgi:CRP-like cAMP-binding protein